MHDLQSARPAPPPLCTADTAPATDAAAAAAADAGRCSSLMTAQVHDTLTTINSQLSQLQLPPDSTTTHYRSVSLCDTGQVTTRPVSVGHCHW